jgi:hypothetical protein
VVVGAGWGRGGREERGGGEEFAEGEGREGNVEDGGVVDGEAEDDADEEELLRGFEGVGVEVAVVRVFVVEEHA